MKTTTTMFDLFDFLLVKVSNHKKMVGPFGQKIAIVGNHKLSNFCLHRCKTSLVKEEPECLDLFSYAIFWELDEERLYQSLLAVGKGGKVVVFSSKQQQDHKIQETAGRGIFAPIEKIQIRQDNVTIYNIKIYSLRANKEKNSVMNYEQLHRCVTRIKFDNTCIRERTSSGGFVAMISWNNCARSMFLVEEKWSD